MIDGIKLPTVNGRDASERVNASAATGNARSMCL